MSKLNVGADLYLKGRIGWKGLSKEEYLVTGEYKIINATALMDGYVNWSNCGFITKERYDESVEIMLKENDILISKDGTLGKIGYVKNLTYPTTVASGVFVLRNTIQGRLNFDYLYHVLKSSIFKDFIYRNKAQGSTINHLYQRDLSNFELELPSLEKQNKIANILNLIDSKIEANTKINQELETLAKTIYDYWFVQFDFPNEKGKPYKTSGGAMVYNDDLKREIPKDWQVDVISNIIEVRDGTHDSPKYVEKGYPLITSKHLLESGLDFASANLISEEDYISINKRSVVETGDILYSMIGTIGVIYRVEEKTIDFAIKNVALFKTSKLDCYRSYIYLYLKSNIMKKHLQEEMAGSIQKYIGLGSLRNIPFLYDEGIINKFNSITKTLFYKINQNKLENQELASLRDWLLPMLMNGQVTFKE